MAGPLLGVVQPQVEIERCATRKLGSQATVARGDDLVAETTWYGDDLPGDGRCGHSAAWAKTGKGRRVARVRLGDCPTVLGASRRGEKPRPRRLAADPPLSRSSLFARTSASGARAPTISPEPVSSPRCSRAARTRLEDRPSP
jgi:hypothetical protein